MATGIPKSYTRSTLQKIQEGRAKLKLQQGLASDDNPDELPNFEVWKYTSSERLDEAYGNHPRYLSGTAQLVAVQASAIKALHDELALRMGYGFTFEEWFEEWQKGFSNLINRPGSQSSLITNYPIRDTGNRTGWRADPESRPQYLEWKSPKSNRKFRVIEYFPEGLSNPTNSIVCSGSDSQIINQIVSYEWGGKEKHEFTSTSETPILGGHPQISLHFSARTRLVGHVHPTRMRISWRLINKIEHADYAYRNESVLTVNEVEELKNKIVTKFKGYTVQRGDTVFSYTFKQLGYSFWQPLRDRSEAIRFYSDILAIQGHSLREDLIKDGKKRVKSATTPPKKKSILGQEVTIHTAFTKEELYFRYAVLKLPISRKSQTLYVA